MALYLPLPTPARCVLTSPDTPPRPLTCWTAPATEKATPLLGVVGAVTPEAGSASLGAQHHEESLGDRCCWLHVRLPRAGPWAAQSQLREPQHLPSEQLLSRRGAPGWRREANFLGPSARHRLQRSSRGLLPAPLKAPLGAESGSPTPTCAFPRVVGDPDLSRPRGPPDPSCAWENVSFQRMGPAPAEPLSRSEVGSGPTPSEAGSRDWPRAPFFAAWGTQAQARFLAVPHVPTHRRRHRRRAAPRPPLHGPGAAALGPPTGRAHGASVRG